MNIYLAGKIKWNCWRHAYVDGLGDCHSDTQILHNAIRGRHAYVGPWFESNAGHGLGHRDSTHGCACELTSRWSNHEPEYCDKARSLVIKRCFHGVDLSDVVIAVITPDAYGTLVEIGYAKAKQKRLIIVNQIGVDGWFAAAGTVGVCTITDALDYCDYEQCLTLSESPAEESFMESLAASFVPGVLRYPIPQYEIGPYRLDFAYPERRLAIEIDGIEFHGNQAAFLRDRQRTRWLESNGWKVIRFAAKEVLDDVEGKAAAEFVFDQWMERKCVEVVA